MKMLALLVALHFSAAAASPLTNVCAAPPPAASGQTATLLSDGRWLLLGGLVDGRPTDAAAIVDPVQSTTTPLPARMRFARAFHTATVLPDGTLFILGGGSDVAEVFDPASDTFTPIPGIGLTARSHHTAALLTSGEILIAGGSDGDAVVFDPILRTITHPYNALPSTASDASSSLLADGGVLLRIGGGAWRFDAAELRFSMLGAGHELPPAKRAEVAATIPADGAAAVPVNVRIAVRFSKCLDVTSIHDRSVTLIGPAGKVAARVVGTNDGQQLFVTPAADLLPGTRYTLFLSGLTDGASDVPFTAVDFTTAAIDPDDEIWQPAVDLLSRSWRTRDVDSPWMHQPPLRAADGVTALAGQVFTLRGMPLSRISLTVDARTAQTDASGRFLLTDVSGGTHVLTIDGRTANHGRVAYGLFQTKVEIAPGRTNVLDYVIWMAALDTRHAIDVASPTRSETIVRTPLIPNLELHIPAGTVIRDLDGNVVTRVSITPIPVNRPPFPLPNVRVPVYFTIQPGGAVLQNVSTGGAAGARLIYPNFDRKKPGAKVDFWNYEPDDKGWYVYGRGTISDDGVYAVPDPGVVIYEFTGAMIADPQNSGPPGKSPVAGGKKGGEPVDLATGLFTYRQTDLALGDVIPIALTRSFNGGDGQPRAFGLNTNFDYGMFLVSGSGSIPTDLILGDGSDIPYTCVSGCNDISVAVLQAKTTPTRFFLSTIRYQRTVEFGWSLTLLDGTTFYFLGDAFTTHQLAAIRDRYGNQVTVTGSGKPISKITSPNGRWIQLNYDNASFPNYVTSANDSAGRTVTYSYDAAGRLSRVIDANGGLTTYQYDAANRMVSITDPNHITYITNVYNAAGQVIEQTLGDGTSKYRFAYTGATGATRTDLTDPNGNARSLQFNADGYPLSDTRAFGTPLAQTTTYQRGAAGNPNFPRTVTDAMGRTTAYAYDDFGNISAVTSLSGTPNAVTWKFTYEPVFQQLLTVTDPLGHTRSFTYDGAFRVAQATDPLGHTTAFAYDDEARLKSVTDPLGHTVSYAYAGADIVSMTNALGQTSTRFADAAGRTVTLTDPLGNQTAYSYDGRDNLLTVTDPLGRKIELSYDADDDLIAVISSNSGTTRYGYNALGQGTLRTDPLGRSESFVFDAVGNELQHTDRKGQITTSAYDVLDRLRKITYADGSSIVLTSDLGNRVTGFADSLNGTITRVFDGLDPTVLR
jgi:YD repeat-containing protein